MPAPSAPIDTADTLLAGDGELRRLYVDERKTVQQVAWILGRSTYRTRKDLMRIGVKPRKKSGYPCNEAFFDTWTPEMAWVLGLLWGLGFLSGAREKSSNVTLNSTDEDVVRKVAALLEFSGPVAAYTGRNNPLTANPKPVFRLTLRSCRIVASLQRLGMTPRMRTSKPFPRVPATVLSHFVRGCVDGHGGVGVPGGTRVAVSVSCAALGFVTELAERVHEAGFGRRDGSPASVCSRQSRVLEKEAAASHTVCWHGWDFLEWLYGDATPAMWMDRKAAAYLETLPALRRNARHACAA